MNLNKIVLAVCLTVPFSLVHADDTYSVPALAGLGITGLVGWEGAIDNDITAKHYKQSGSQALNPPFGYGLHPYADVVWGAGLSYELTPSLTVEGEFNQKEGRGSIHTQASSGGALLPNRVDVRTRSESLNLLINSNMLGLSEYLGPNFKPYVLAGAGYQRMNVHDHGITIHDMGTIVNLGIGSLYRLNDIVALRAEGRAVDETYHNLWNYKALVGLVFTPWGHKGLYVAPAPVEVPPAPMPMPEPTPAPVEVPAPAPAELTEDLKLELRVFFDTNKSIIKAQYQPEIAKVADKLKEFPNATAEIKGYTDSTGPRKLNDRLSQARAESVKTSLVSDYGIDAGRLTAKGYSWDDPVASNKTKEGRALNRRVVAVVVGSRIVTK